MITFGLNYDVKPEYMDKFKEVSYAAIDMMQDLEGHVKTVLYSDTKRPNSLMIYSEWVEDQNFRNFVRSEAFKNVQNMTSDMLEQRPKHSLYESRSMR